MLSEIDLVAVHLVDDPSAATDPRHDESLVGQQPIGALDGVEVDVERVSELSSGWEPITGSEPAIDQCCAHARGDLQIDRCPGIEVDLDQHGGPHEASPATASEARLSSRLLITPAGTEGLAIEITISV